MVWLVKIKNLLVNKNGQSLIEVIVAMAIFALMATAMIGLSLGSFNSLQRGGDNTEARALAMEGIEAVRSIRDGAWNELIINQSAVEVSGGQWIFTGEGTTETLGKYTRTITIENVCRNVTDDIITCPGSYTDPHSKKVTVVISWVTTNNANVSIQEVSYLTNWDSTEWLEDTEADFNDGTFSNTATSTSLGDLDGAIILQLQ